VDNGRIVKALLAEVIVLAVVALVSNTNDLGLARVAVGRVDEAGLDLSSRLTVGGLLVATSSSSSVEAWLPEDGRLVRRGERVPRVFGGCIGEAGIAEVVVSAVIALVAKTDNVSVAAVANSGVTEATFLLSGRWRGEDGVSVVMVSVMSVGSKATRRHWSGEYIHRMSLVVTVMSVVAGAVAKALVRDNNLQCFVLVETQGLTQFTLRSELN